MIRIILSIFVIILMIAPAQADSHDHKHIQTDAPNFKAQKLTDHITMLSGKGGNMAVFKGPTETIIVDTDYPDLAPALSDHIDFSKLSTLINTHFHYDHTANNGYIDEQAGGVNIIAGPNVKERLSGETYIPAFDLRFGPFDENALPDETITQTTSLNVDGKSIDLIPVDSAHTDGDMIIHFKDENVIHMGDLFFNGFYPFIDPGAEGNLAGMVAGIDTGLALANDQTKIIPGHGPLGDAESLRELRYMLASVDGIMKGLIAQDKTKEEIIAAKPTADFDEEWGDGFLTPDQWVGIIFETYKN